MFCMKIPHEKFVGVTSPIYVQNSLQKPFFQIETATCQTFSIFYSVYNELSLFVSVSDELYEKSIVI